MPISKHTLLSRILFYDVILVPLKHYYSSCLRSDIGFSVWPEDSKTAVQSNKFALQSFISNLVSSDIFQVKDSWSPTYFILLEMNTNNVYCAQLIVYVWCKIELYIIDNFYNK